MVQHGLVSDEVGKVPFGLLEREVDEDQVDNSKTTHTHHKARWQLAQDSLRGPVNAGGSEYALCMSL